MTSENKASSFDLAAASQASKPVSKEALIHQALQTQGIEVQEEIEKEVALALHNYRHSMKSLRKNLFKPRVDLKNQIRELDKKAQEKRAQNEEGKPQEIPKEDEEVFLMFPVSFENSPLTTRHYIASASNIRADNSSTLNLLSFGAFKFFSDMTFKDDLHYLIREMGEPEARVHDLNLHKLNFVCQFVAERMKSTDFSIMVILAKILDKSPQCLLKFWLRIQKNKVIKRPQKIFAYKNSQYFCTMCRKYICNLHFEEGPVLFIDKEPDYEYSPYFTRFTVAFDKEAQRENKFPSKKMRVYDEEELVPSYHLLYKCPKGIENDCYLKDDKREEDVVVDNFEEYEEEFILNYCLKYGFTNPCAIRLLLNSKKRACWEINYFISKKHASSPRNTMPKSLIENVKLSKSELNFIKSKKGPRAQEWGHYRPCFHPGEPCKFECACTEFGSCEIFCGCPRDCPLRFQGCNCKAGRCTENINCPCMKIGRNCDPELCKSCSSEINLRLVKKRNSRVVACANTALLYRYKPRLLLGRSEICEGMGIYAGQNFEKGDFIGEYVGELISESEGQIRGSMYNSLGCSYMFNYDSESSVDAYFYGNKIRFVNHGIGKYENSFPKYIFVRGGVRIGLFAMKDIKIGEEILFNYGTDYQLEWLLEYNKQVQEEMKKERDAKKKRRRKRLSNIVLFEEKETPENFLKFLDDA